MAVLQDVSKKSGVNQDMIATVFSAILSLVASGEDVKVQGFGTFKRRLFKGRTLNTPLMSKPVVYQDSYVFKFHQSNLAKIALNALAKGEEVPARPNGKKGPKPKAKPEPEEEEVDVPAKKAPAKKAAATPAKKPVLKSVPPPPPEEDDETPAPKKKAPAAPAKKAAPPPVAKKKAPPPPVEEEEDDEEELEESEEESDDDDDSDDEE